MVVTVPKIVYTMLFEAFEVSLMGQMWSHRSLRKDESPLFPSNSTHAIRLICMLRVII